MSGTNSTSNRLLEVDIIKSIAIILLLLYHSFAPFSGRWPEVPYMNCNVPIYSWLDKFFYSGMLESFVMVSGYLMGMKLTSMQINRGQIILRRLKRLYIPTIFWGIIYVLIFNSSVLSIDGMVKTTIDIIDGVGHLWFLPMLFWCILFELYVGKFFPDKYLWVYAILALIPLPSVPIIRLSLYYSFFFHLGIVFYRNKEDIISRMSVKKLGVILLVYLIIFIIASIIQDKFLNDDVLNKCGLLYKAALLSLKNALRLSYSFIAIYILYYIGTKLKLNSTTAKIVNSLAICSSGIYIVHQFILRGLYYKSEICKVFPFEFEPWVYFFMLFIISYLISYVLNTNKLTKQIV